jgi:hypothetical protein
MQSPTIETQRSTYQPWQISFVFRILTNETTNGQPTYDPARLDRAQDIVEAGKLRRPDADDYCSARWLVESCSEMAEYPVTDRVCGCRDHERTGDWCKHGLAALAMELLETLYPAPTPEPTEPAPLTCPRCGQAADGEWNARAMRSEGICCRCISALQFPDDDDAA